MQRKREREKMRKISKKKSSTLLPLSKYATLKKISNYRNQKFPAVCLIIRRKSEKSG